MEPASHPEPFTESIGYSAQRVTQLASVFLTAAQAYVIYRSRRAAIRAAQDGQARHALLEQHHLAWQQARLGWAPAFDQRWLSQASIGQAARLWAAAVPWADADENAATAMRHAEERLRTLHPYAMTWYDRHRAEGMTSTDAMTRAAPLFDRPPRAREGDPGRPRASLPAGSEERLASQAEHSRADDLAAPFGTGSAEMTRPAGHDAAEATAEAGIAADLTARSVTSRAAARAAALAAQSFPMTAADALRANAGAAAGTRPRRQYVRQQVVRREVAM